MRRLGYAQMSDAELVQLAAEAEPPLHTRRILQVGNVDDYLAYCTICQWYQRGALYEVMGMWAQHLDDVGQRRHFGGGAEA